MQLHQFPAEIFVQPALLWFLVLPLLRRARRITVRPAAHLLARGAFGGQALRGIGISAQEIIQIEKHRRALRGGGDQVAELAESVWLNDVALVRREIPFHFALPGENIEVVEPEIVHHLLQLPFAINRAKHLGHGKLFHDSLRALAVVGDRSRNCVWIHSQRISLRSPARGRIELHR